MLVVISAHQIGRFASSLLLAAVWAWTLVCSPVTSSCADPRCERSAAPCHCVEEHPATKRSEVRAEAIDPSVDEAATLDMAEAVRAPRVAVLLPSIERPDGAALPHRFTYSARGPPVQA